MFSISALDAYLPAHERTSAREKPIYKLYVRQLD